MNWMPFVIICLGCALLALVATLWNGLPRTSRFCVLFVGLIVTFTTLL